MTSKKGINSAFRDPRRIELLNSCGHFKTSHWDGLGVRVTHEEDLRGRADFVARQLRKIILGRFSRNKLRYMSIVDVGCYDGWILHQLSDLPFKKMTGIEPRARNIEKGERVRKLLGIKTRVKFKIGNIAELPREKYDIVLCLRTLQHLDSSFSPLEKLDAITKRLLIIDSIIMPSAHITDVFRRDIEMKDPIYSIKPKICGLTGQKYESSYYDGSTLKTSVVNIPSLESLKMYLDVLGYAPVVVAAWPAEFKKIMTKSIWPFEEVLIYGTKGKSSIDATVTAFVESYERALTTRPLPLSIVVPLYERYCLGKKPHATSRVARLIMRHIDSKHGNQELFRKYFKNSFDLEMVKNLRFNSVDKIRFEYGKALFAKKSHREAAEVLRSITQKLNADWRTVYRSFYLLSRIYRAIGNRKESVRYAKLCRHCHANFPLL